MKLIKSIATISLVLITFSCYNEDNSLDPAIPRLESPIHKIAYFRTKWWEGKHIQTTFFDRQNRPLETFNFGLSCSKIINEYDGNLPAKTIFYEHSDSSESGLVSVDTTIREFDSRGRLVIESHFRGTIKGIGNRDQGYIQRRYLAYSAAGDTIITKQEGYLATDSSQIANVSLWDRDHKKFLRRYYRLYVIGNPPEYKPDTIFHFTQRYVYDQHGKLKMAWFDHMYLGMFYMPAGADTIFYEYNSKSQLVKESHHYTTDLRNKKEIDTTSLSKQNRETVSLFRNLFFNSDSNGRNNNRTYVVKYQYEKFDPGKHRNLEIP